MEGSVADNLRSRSRSNTPLPRNNPPERGTPTRNVDVEPIAEDVEEIFTSPPAHRTRNALKQKTLNPEDATGTTNANATSSIVTSNVDHQDLYEQNASNRNDHVPEEIIQNLKNYSYEYKQTSSSKTTKTVTTSNNSHSYSPGPYYGSTTYDSGNYAFLKNNYDYNRAHLSSSCSDRSNDSFAESILADSSKISKEGTDHLPYRVYHNAIEYWNKYPKTDYTYSHLSRDRVELAPGQVAVPNMSRLSLDLYRQGIPVYSGGLDEDESAALQSRTEDLQKRWISDNSSSQSRSEEIRRRWIPDNSSARSYANNYRRDEIYADSDYDETDVVQSRTKTPLIRDQRWWITRILMSIITTITTTTTTIKNKIFRRDSSQRYPYTSVGRYNAYSQNKSWAASATESIKKRKWSLLLLLFLLPFLFLLYTKPEYREQLPSVTLPSLPDSIVPDFSDMDLYLKGFSLPDIELPNITIPDLSSFNISLPEIPFINASMPELPEAYYTYKTIAGEKLYNTYDYIKSSLGYLFGSLQKAVTDFFQQDRLVTS